MYVCKSHLLYFEVVFRLILAAFVMVRKCVAMLFLVGRVLRTECPVILEWVRGFWILITFAIVRYSI